MPGRPRRAAIALLAALAAGLAGCGPTVIADGADPCGPARRAFRQLASDYLDLAGTGPVPLPHTASLLLQRAASVVGEGDDDFDRLYAQTADLPGLDRAAADEIAARRDQVQALGAAWGALAGCRRAQAAAQPGGQATQPARLRHEEDLRSLRQTGEATAAWSRRYDRLRRRIADLAGNRDSAATPLAASTFAAAANAYAAAIADARAEAATHFTPR